MLPVFQANGGGAGSVTNVRVTRWIRSGDLYSCFIQFFSGTEVIEEIKVWANSRFEILSDDGGSTCLQKINQAMSKLNERLRAASR